MVNEYGGYITCPKCGHDRNVSTAKKCEICGQKLGKQSSALPLILAGGVGLLALLGGGYVVFKDLLNKPANVAVTASPSPTTSPATHPTTVTSGGKSGGNSAGKTGSTSTNAPPLGKTDLITAANPELYATLAQIPNVPTGTFNYGGSTTFAPLRSSRVVQAITSAHPDFKLRYTDPASEQPGSGTGIAMVIAGELSFAQSSRPLKDAEPARAKQRGVSLEQVPIAYDGLAFYVNPQLQLPGLTLGQIRDIYTGKVTNWQQVGGPNLPVVALSRDPSTGGTVDFFLDEVLRKQALGRSVTLVRDTTTSLRQVAKTPGGIGYATAPEVIGQSTIRPLPIAKSAGQGFISPFAAGNTRTVNQTAIADGSYPLTRRLFIIIRRDGRLDEQAGVAYTNMLLSQEGQDLIKAAGFAPVR